MPIVPPPIQITQGPPFRSLPHLPLLLGPRPLIIRAKSFLLRHPKVDLSGVGQELASLDGHVTDILRSLSNGFQKLEKIKDTNRQSRQLEELTGKMKECKRLIKEFDRVIKEEKARISPDIIRKLNEKNNQWSKN